MTLGEYLNKRFHDSRADVNEICSVSLTTTQGNTYTLEWSTAVFSHTGDELNIVLAHKPGAPQVQLFGVDSITFSPLENSWRVYVFEMTGAGFDLLVHKDTRHCVLRPSRKRKKLHPEALKDYCFKIELP